MGRSMWRCGLALLLDAACCVAAGKDRDLVADDECGLEDASGCALHVLQHKASPVLAPEVKSEELEWNASLDGQHEYHALTITDHGDYRHDAFSFLQRALGDGGDSGKVSLRDQRVDEDQVNDRCRLPRMSFAEVERRWKKHLQITLGQTVDNHTEHDLLRAKVAFHSQLAGGKPVRVDADVMEQLGWPAKHLWEQDEMVRRLHGIKLPTYSFVYPDWAMPSLAIQEEKFDPVMDAIPPNETLEDYLASGQSYENVFLFAVQHSKAEKSTPNADLIIEALREDFSPHPSFAFRPDQNRSILAIDGIGSSHGFHSHDAVWQAQVKGHKMWYLLPPEHAVTKRGSDGFPAEFTAPLVDGKPVEYPNACIFLQQRKAPPGTLECLFGPGEMLILPHTWLHATCGLSNYTAAVGGWLPDEDNLVDGQ